ncbi:hypothetical protein HOLleu_15812 [Holothuria leucospilota]|uniref:Uncharacterized protein n=1 Tax=Holothuria leucospilota TaxID=206669 RepID=A0A9Q1C4T8_HOLLE|nr:hypothetical protein HOLleu_15812 [Holothuria leucospilota]
MYIIKYDTIRLMTYFLLKNCCFSSNFESETHAAGYSQLSILATSSDPSSSPRSSMRGMMARHDEFHRDVMKDTE